MSPDELLLDRMQRSAFGYFALPPADNGLVPDTTRPSAPASIAVVGFALSAYPVGVERGWMSRSDAIARTLSTLRFFHDSAQSEGRDATGHRGFYYHFLDTKTGRRTWQCELSLIDTALLVAGALVAGVYFDGTASDEKEIRDLADALYRRIDWQWALRDEMALSHGWKPECGFLHYGWEGYSEAALLYVLALASPTHPIGRESYTAWTTTYQWEQIYGHDLLYAGPLFVHQFSHAWIDFEGIRDAFMRDKRSDYFENTRRATHVQREYAHYNPRGFAGYDRDGWGLSACDGPEPRGYTARGAPYGPDDGTLAPTSIVGSLPFAPDVVSSALRRLVDRYPSLAWNMLPSGLNPSRGDGAAPWVSDGFFGLDQGLVVLMIENFRSRLIWRLMRACPHVVTGLRRAGFRDGWLGDAAA